MNRARYETTLIQVRLMNTLATSAVVTDEDIQELIEANEHAVVMGPVLDPTAWIAGHETVQAVTACARALLVYRRAIREATR